MEEVKLNDDVFEQIKGFNRDHLTEEQKLLIDKLILNEELKERYKDYGLCKDCKQPNAGGLSWCKSCNSERFRQNFKNWTSGNNIIDKFIQDAQLEAKHHREILEWIEYDNFKDVEYLAKGGFGITYKALWKDGYINWWDSKNNKWDRSRNTKIVLKCLNNSQNITAEFIKEVRINNFFF
jgi:hypothetical protein